jgi:hypothetical protein
VENFLQIADSKLIFINLLNGYLLKIFKKYIIENMLGTPVGVGVSG